MQILRGRRIGIRNLAVSPDSRYVAVGGAVACHVWDLHEPKAKPQAAAEVIYPLTSLQFTTSNNLLAWCRAHWQSSSLLFLNCSNEQLARVVQGALAVLRRRDRFR